MPVIIDLKKIQTMLLKVTKCPTPNSVLNFPKNTNWSASSQSVQFIGLFVHPYIVQKDASNLSVGIPLGHEHWGPINFIFWKRLQLVVRNHAPDSNFWGLSYEMGRFHGVLERPNVRKLELVILNLVEVQSTTCIFFMLLGAVLCCPKNRMLTPRSINYNLFLCS